MYATAAPGARIEYRIFSIPGFVKLHPEIKLDTQGPLFDNIDYRTCLVNMTDCDMSNFGKYWQAGPQTFVAGLSTHIGKTWTKQQSGYFK